MHLSFEALMTTGNMVWRVATWSDKQSYHTNNEGCYTYPLRVAPTRSSQPIHTFMFESQIQPTFRPQFEILQVHEATTGFPR